MTIDLYHLPGSAPCRAVRLAAAAVGVELNLKICDLLKGEHLKPEYLMMNPQHTIPTMNDNGFYLWESRAIMTYLAEQYGKNDSLYPKDPKMRAVVNQRLYFDMGNLYQAFAEYYYPQIFANAPKDPVKFEKLGTALGFLDKFLEGENYVAGKNLTLADLAIVVTVSNYEGVGYDFSSFKNVAKWYSRVKKETPKYEQVNVEGLKMFQSLVESLQNKK